MTMPGNNNQEQIPSTITLSRKIIRAEAKIRALEGILTQVLAQASIDPKSVQEGLRIQESLELNGAFRDAECLDQGIAAMLDDRTEEEMQFLLKAQERVSSPEEDR
jgi:hypothetical protein